MKKFASLFECVRTINYFEIILQSESGKATSNAFR